MFLLVVFLLLVAVAIAVLPEADFIRMKLFAYAHGTKFMFTADDLPKKFTGNNYIPMQTKVPLVGKRVIRVVFIRHGQSVWNSLFNTFNATWPLRVLYYPFWELFYLFSSPFKSVIIDTPLSFTGRQEAHALAEFVRSPKGGKLPSNPHTSRIVCSNLRRAMETAAIALDARVSATREKIAVDSALQEGSRNIDSQTLSTEKGKLAPCTVGKYAPDMLSAVFDAHLNAGNRTSAVNVYGRIDEFVRHLFGDSAVCALQPASHTAAGNADLKEIIVVGHSGFFLRFFRRFLPARSSHVAKQKKMKNCAVVAFDLVHNETTNEVYIDEATLSVLYKGF